MSTTMRGALVSCSYPGGKDNSMCSGLLFFEEWILTLGTILEPAFNKKEDNSLYQHLLSYTSSRSQINLTSSFPHSFNSFQFNAVVENDEYSNTSIYVQKSTSTTKRRYYNQDSPSLVPHKRISAQLVASWQCPLVADAVGSVLYDWRLSPENQKDKVFENLLSTFLLFRVGDDVSPVVTLDAVMCVLDRLVQQVEAPRRGQDVVIESTLFGREFFFNSQSQGIVSNMLGKQGCLLLTDARAGVGCEGGPIFAQKESPSQRVLVGLVLSAVSWWKGEWVGFTLGVALHPIITRLRQDDNRLILPPVIKSTKNLAHIDKRVVLVRCGSDWGSGVVVDASLGLILTCSHVVKNDNPISVLWRDNTLDASLVYRTRDGVAYDVAVLRVTPPPGMQQASISTDTPVKGEKVYIVGFPLFSTHAHHATLLPTATRGIISHVAPPLMVQTTCCVQSGVSGGPVMRENGDLLAIVSCNAHDLATGALFPHVNMAVPSMAFAKALRQYCHTLDVKTLWSLEEPDEHVQKMWKLNFTKCKL